MTEKELKLKVIENADSIAKVLRNGADVELRKTANGVSVAEVKKRIVNR